MMTGETSEHRWARVLTPADLGRFLAELRAELDLTQEELAEELGISRRYLWEIESGKPSLYSTRLFALLRRLGARLTIEADVPKDEA
jgi:HTH-type transcriptional regulator/antitoxin HipB